MKKKLLSAYLLPYFLLIGLLSSCSLDDDSTVDFSTDIMPIESVDMDDEFIFGEVHTIKMTYITPSSCYQFNDFIYDVEGNERTIAILNTVYNDDNCTTAEESVEVSLDITVTSIDTYVFRFFQGKDEEDNDLYHIVEVPVVE